MNKKEYTKLVKDVTNYIADDMRIQSSHLVIDFDFLNMLAQDAHDKKLEKQSTLIENKYTKALQKNQSTSKVADYVDKLFDTSNAQMNVIG